ncbi:disease resistance protein RPP13-like isoform X2 [Salvia hispanica]|nr:disease resistance protein RPP13-like isoform X2 [Salvia hispanica]
MLDILRMIKKRMTEFKPQSSVGGEEEEEEGTVVVGLEKDVKQLVERAILVENPDLVSVGIKGMVGVGKTTLAKQVYNHAAIVEKFKWRAWVSVSIGTSVNEMLVEVVKQLVGIDGNDSSLEGMDNQSLRQMLRQHMEGLPYFIVIDNLMPQISVECFAKDLQHICDMPSIVYEKHEELKVEGNGSRLLLISRHEIISEDLYYTHEMKALDSDNSWKLFIQTLFHGDRFATDKLKFSKDLEHKAKEMLKKCWGLPIAIIDVARQKAKQRLSGIEWEQLFDSIDLDKTLKRLEPMYDELEEKLKACFLLLSLFKENAIMREEKMEQIWAASGLNTRSEEPIIRSLFRQSIIEIVHPHPQPPKVKMCRMNPLLHMLSIKKAEDEMGFEMLRSNGNNRPSQSPRHRVIHCGRDKFNHLMTQDKLLVSLIFHGGGRYLDDTSQSYWKSFELLKILDMEDFGVKTLPESISTLSELEYLGLRNNYIQEIPESLGGLEKLEVLDIALNFLVEVPDILNEMGSLHHLYMSNVICRKPLQVDALKHLENLTYISIYDWTYEVLSLEKMICLQKLGIEEIDENADVSKLFASLCRLKSLEGLSLRGFRFMSMPCLEEIYVSGIRTVKLDGLLATTLPGNLRDSLQIRDLTLVNTCLEEDPMWLLRMLFYLRRLKLQNAYIGRHMCIDFRQFQELEFVCISELWNLRDLYVIRTKLSKLKHLDINSCPHLETLPKEIEELKHLRKLTMVTSKHIATKIRNSSIISKIVEVDISP